jgi:hypothetical protein
VDSTLREECTDERLLDLNLLATIWRRPMPTSLPHGTDPALLDGSVRAAPIPPG